MSQHQFLKKLEISERFVLVRKRVGNQSDLAKILGISSDYVSMIETGKREPGPRLLKDFEDLERKTVQPLSGNTDSVKPGLVANEDSPEYKTADEWKAEALKLRTEVTRLKVVIQILASTARPVSSSEAVSAEEFVTDIVNRIAAQAAAQSPPGPKPKS